MGPPSCMRSVVDQNVVIPRIPLYGASFKTVIIEEIIYKFVYHLMSYLNITQLTFTELLLDSFCVELLYPASV